MKTNRFARGILKLRVILFCLAVVGMAELGMKLGEALPVRVTPAAYQAPLVPNAGLADALACL